MLGYVRHSKVSKVGYRKVWFG